MIQTIDLAFGIYCGNPHASMRFNELVIDFSSRRLFVCVLKLPNLH
jgi:hypothetical protein